MNEYFSYEDYVGYIVENADWCEVYEQAELHHQNKQCTCPIEPCLYETIRLGLKVRYDRNIDSLTVYPYVKRLV